MNGNKIIHQEATFRKEYLCREAKSNGIRVVDRPQTKWPRSGWTVAVLSAAEIGV